MIIDCISDLHGYEPTLEGGDLLIVAGDLTASDMGYQYLQFLDWLKEQKYDKKVVIAGNHDGLLEGGRWKTCTPLEYTDDPTIEYLQDSGTKFKGLKIWGSPWTPIFCNWHFMAGPGDRKSKCALIPDDIDILITHGPPHGILDTCPDMDGKNKQVGCKHLRDILYSEKIKPKLHVFGHIHESYGHIRKMLDYPHTQFVNASIMDRDYNPVNKPIRIIL